VNLTFYPLDRTNAIEIVRWRYDPPYDVYNLEDDETVIQYALDPENNFYAMDDKKLGLVGFCSFGLDGQVPGGDYVENALDIGMGIRPDLTGRGLGSGFVAEVLAFARQMYAPVRIRVTIAAFNERAKRVWEANHFRPHQRFVHHASNREFVVMMEEFLG
jgi:RimJ/RimL family protein N-acetyltransferase